MYETIIVDRQDRVATIRLNRPKALNALNTRVMEEMVVAMTPLDRDPEVGCFVVTGSERAFAAGADIAEMQPQGFFDVFDADYFAGWERFAAFRTPKIAAVAGYALGGGCELAMMCDLILAADTARFGQPEIKLGVIPGIGGTQRLTRPVGRARAMDLILTGRMMDADEAERAGLVSRVVAADRLEEEAREAAQAIAGYSKAAVMMARECVAMAEETGLTEGIRFERRVFHSVFATQDQKEGMSAFLEKRPPEFVGR
ncbi:MAG: enoyl-CoA hydratase [Hyphomicrobiales bacterium]|nr:enoyl-CoA hydratase [Hyphomicrobiales bacterium]